MTVNQVNKVETVELEFDGSPVTAIMMAVDCHDLSVADTFIASVIDEFLSHRMISPPDTNALLVTLVGAMRPEEFAFFWNEHVESNAALQVFMSQMKVADVVWSAPDGEILGVSLI